MTETTTDNIIHESEEQSLYSLKKELKDIFGFSEFRENQEDLIKAVMRRSDVFAVMPTGGGKSLCYQLPARLMKGTCIVVSPLIALMKDQVDAANATGLSAAFINSSLDGIEIVEIYDSLGRGELDLLYIAPERFAVPGFTDRLKKTDISFFAIDEAHCISEWGHDFRPDYLFLSRLSTLFPGIPVAAFTATATEKVQEDIINRLSLDSAFKVRASFDRPELFYEVASKSDAEGQILDFIKKHHGESGIVYRTTRKSVEETAEFLQLQGVNALPYHAGLDQALRRDNQDSFNRDRADIIVATIAFGMGIDKSNIRYIIHGDLPKNIEGYYQETGRAGRDGEASHCLLLFGRGDIPKIKYFINQIEEEADKRNAMDKLNSMVNLVTSPSCRRKGLLNYFDEQYGLKNCGSCDVCTGTFDQVDATEDARIILSAIARTDQVFGAVHIVDVVRGANTARIKKFRHNEIKTWGAGKHKDKSYWRDVIDALLADGHILQTDSLRPSLVISAAGKELLMGNTAFQMIFRGEGSKGKAAGTDYSPELFGILKELRKDISEKEDVPPFVVFSDRTLHEMSRAFPRDENSMLDVTGVGQSKFQKYGRLFLAAIEGFVLENPGIEEQYTATVVRNKKTSLNKKSETREITMSMLREGKSFLEIAAERELTPGTIVAHITKLTAEGLDVDFSVHVSEEKKEMIEGLFKTMNSSYLREIVEAGNNSFSYEEARLVRLWMQQ